MVSIAALENFTVTTMVFQVLTGIAALLAVGIILIRRGQVNRAG